MMNSYLTDTDTEVAKRHRIGHPDAYLADTQIAKRYSIARPTVWRWHREKPDFPRAIRLSPGCTRWKLSEIEAWEVAQVEAA